MRDHWSKVLRSNRYVYIGRGGESEQGVSNTFKKTMQVVSFEQRECMGYKQEARRNE